MMVKDCRSFQVDPSAGPPGRVAQVLLDGLQHLLVLEVGCFDVVDQP